MLLGGGSLYGVDNTVIEQAIATLQSKYKAKVQIEVMSLKNHVIAEAYHQDYLKKNPNGYCHIDIAQAGIYVDVTTGEPVFSSNDKFESAVAGQVLLSRLPKMCCIINTDNSFNMQRTEVLSRSGNAHLGHVFDDSPKDRGGLRYCINSASIKFIPLAEMKKISAGAF